MEDSVATRLSTEHVLVVEPDRRRGLPRRSRSAGRVRRLRVELRRARALDAPVKICAATYWFAHTILACAPVHRARSRATSRRSDASWSPGARFRSPARSHTRRTGTALRAEGHLPARSASANPPRRLALIDTICVRRGQGDETVVSCKPPVRLDSVYRLARATITNGVRIAEQQKLDSASSSIPRFSSRRTPPSADISPDVHDVSYDAQTAIEATGRCIGAGREQHGRPVGMHVSDVWMARSVCAECPDR